MTTEEPWATEHTGTHVLGRTHAAAEADPVAPTEVVPRPAPADPDAVVTAIDPPDSGQLPEPLVSRRVAAEIGMYLGAGLVALSVAGSVAGGWSTWEPALRATFFALVSVALLAVGLFVRLPWRARPSTQRRRAVSVLLTAAIAAAAAAVVSGWPAAGQVPPDGPALAAAVGLLVAMVVVNLIAATPLSESAVLVVATWVAWASLAPGPARWALVAGLGVVWAVLGMRWARGRWLAGALGSALALAASVPLADGDLRWPVRGALIALALFGLTAFVRGRANYWLVLGAGASTAVAASVAREFVGSGPGLFIGGLATMLVSWIALRTAGPA